MILSSSQQRSFHSQPLRSLHSLTQHTAVFTPPTSTLLSYSDLSTSSTLSLTLHFILFSMSLPLTSSSSVCLQLLYAPCMLIKPAAPPCHPTPSLNSKPPCPYHLPYHFPSALAENYPPENVTLPPTPQCRQFTNIPPPLESYL